MLNSATYIIKSLSSQVIVAERDDSFGAVIREVDEDEIIGTSLQRLATSIGDVLAEEDLDESFVGGKLFGVIFGNSCVNLKINQYKILWKWNTKKSTTIGSWVNV